MVHIKKSPLLLLIVALGLLGVVDYIAANVIEQGYAQDANQVKRHIQLCSLTEAISKLDYDAGVAMGGYSVTKDSLFYSRFQRISAELTKELEELRQLVSSIPEEKAACQSISELSTAILDVNRKAKSMIDEPLVTEDQIKQRHLYETVHADADRVQEAIKILREKDLALLNGNVHRRSLPITQTSGAKIFFLAFLNAILGCGLLGFLASRKETTGS